MVIESPNWINSSNMAGEWEASHDVTENFTWDVKLNTGTRHTRTSQLTPEQKHQADCCGTIQIHNKRAQSKQSHFHPGERPNEFMLRRTCHWIVSLSVSKANIYIFSQALNFANKLWMYTDPSSMFASVI